MVEQSREEERKEQKVRTRKGGRMGKRKEKEITKLQIQEEHILLKTGSLDNAIREFSLA